MVKFTYGVDGVEPTSSVAAWHSVLLGLDPGLRASSVAVRANDVKYGYPPSEPFAILNFVIKYGLLAPATAVQLNVLV